jgi:peptide/nickel transport system substrate-binding protein
MLLSLFGLAGTARAAAVDPDTLKVAELWEIEGMDVASHEGTFLKEKALVVETLVDSDPQFNLKPQLAESWKMVSDTQWEFILRPGVKFHDGTPLTAQDVAACLERTLKLDASSKQFSMIKGLKAKDDRTVIIETERLNPMLPAALVYSNLSIVSLKSKANEQGAILHPIGTGPYRLVEWKQAENVVVLERNENYWGPKTKIKKVIFRAVPDPATRSLELQKGSLDFVPDAPYGDLDLLKKAGLNVRIDNTARVYLLAFGSIKGAVYENPAVRQAVSLAVNREPIVSKVLFGMGKPAAGPFEKGMSFANPDLAPLAYDKEKAKSLLAQAGWKDTNGDGIVDKDGQPFALTLYTYPQRPGLRPMAQAIQAQLQDIGLKVEVRIMDWSAISKTMKPGDLRIVAAATAMIPDPDFFLRNYYHSKGSSNTWGYLNPEVDKLLDEGAQTVDPAKRKAVYNQIQALVYQDMPVVPISYYGVNVVMKPQVKNFVFNPVAHDYMLNTDMFIEP